MSRQVAIKVPSAFRAIEFTRSRPVGHQLKFARSRGDGHRASNNSDMHDGCSGRMAMWTTRQRRRLKGHDFPADARIFRFELVQIRLTDFQHSDGSRHGTSGGAERALACHFKRSESTGGGEGLTGGLGVPVGGATFDESAVGQLCERNGSFE